MHSKASAKCLTYVSQGPYVRTRPHVRKFIPAYAKPQEHTCVCKNRAAYTCMQVANVGLSPLKEGYKRRKEDMRKWLENLGERNRRVVRKKKSQREGNPIQISQSGIIFTISLRSKEDYKKDSQKPLVVSFKNLHHHL